MQCWQNGTRCRDGVKLVLWYHSHLIWLVFEGSIPTCFHSETSCCCCFFFILLFRNGKRKERWGRGKGEDAWSMKYDNNIKLFIHVILRIIKIQMLPSGILNPNITLLYLRGFRAYKPPTHFMWTAIKFLPKNSLYRLSPQSIES